MNITILIQKQELYIENIEKIKNNKKINMLINK